MGRHTKTRYCERIRNLPVTRFGHHVPCPGVDGLDRLGPLWVVDLRLGGLCKLTFNQFILVGVRHECSPCQSDAEDEQASPRKWISDEGHAHVRMTATVTP